MKIKEYLVTDPAGVVWNGDIVVQGGTITAADDGRLKAYLHFKQVKETGAAAEIAPEPAPAPAAALNVGIPNPEPGQSAAVVGAAVELPGAATVAGGGEFVAAPAAAVTLDQAAPAALPESVTAPERAKRKTK
jgi:hypothetical protein